MDPEINPCGRSPLSLNKGTKPNGRKAASLTSGHSQEKDKLQQRNQLEGVTVKDGKSRPEPLKLLQESVEIHLNTQALFTFIFD